MAKAFQKTAKMTSIGGQALIEGILMRGPEKVACAFLKSDGRIELEEKEVLSPGKKHKILSWPLIRGVATMCQSLSLGMRALTDSAERADGYDDVEPTKFDKWLSSKISEEKLEKLAIGFACVLGVLLPIGLYMILPALLTSFLRPMIPSNILLNLIEGVLKIGIFLLFLLVTSRIPDMHRVYSFHGAEHKTIYCYEKGLELTVENVRPQERFHPRCGTSFMFVVLIIGILVYSFISWKNMWVRLGIRLLCLPLLVGITYEINRYVGRNDNFFTRALRAPGLLVQHLTVFEPDDDMIRAAIAAMQAVIPKDDSDRW